MRPLLFGCFAIVALIPCVPSSLRAGDTIDLSKFTILSAVEDVHPDGSKTRLYKIVPPPPKPKAPEPAPQPALSPEQQAAYLAEAQRRSGGTWSFGGTVYPSSPSTRVTQLRWQHEGAHYEAWSRVDFNHLRGVGHLDIDGRYHSFFLMIGTQEEMDAGLTIPPTLATAPEGFVLTKGDPKNTAALAGVRLLHQHYAANTTALIEESRQRELRDEAARNAPKPPKKDTIIIYTDIQSVPNGGAQ